MTRPKIPRHHEFAVLREAERTLRSIIEHSTNLFYMHTADHVLTYVSPQSRRYFDCEPEEALLRWTDFITDHPSNRTAVEITQRAIDTCERQPAYEVECISRTGRKIWVEVNETPIVKDGKTVAVVGSLTDITERKRAEEELRRSEERFRHLYNETPAMLHSIDDEGCLVSVSNHWLEKLGYERSEVIGRRSTDFLTAESQRYANEVVLPEFFRTGFCSEVPYQMVKKNGAVLDILLSSTAERDQTGKVIRSLAVIVDVTERNKAQKEIEKLNTDLAARAIELENANRELKAFSYTVSHDLRNPLTVISTYSQVIENLCGNNLNRQCRGYLKEISNTILRLGETIDALLCLSCVGFDELNRETVDLSEVARHVCSELSLAEPQRQVTFRIANGVTVNGDARLLRVVLDNLLGNAWKYTSTRQEAIIDFGVADINREKTCFVRDNGVGFDLEKAGNLFTPFHRLSGVKGYKGHGIGLATVERIIRRHGGRIWAEATPDDGATFYFTLP